MALEIFKLVGSVFVDTDKAEKSLKKTDKTAEGFGSKLLSVGKTAGKFALGVAGAAAAAGTAVVALTESTREYRTEQGKLQTAFRTQNFTAEQARKTYTELNGILGDSGQAVEAANHLAKLAANEQDLATWTDICTGVYATFGDSLPIEGLTEAANETAKTGALTGSLADALNWAGVNEEEFQKKLDACNSEQERAMLITQTMNGLYSESAETYRELNADIIAANKAQDRLNSAMAAVGGALEPFVTKGKELLADVLEKCIPVLEELGAFILNELAPAFQEVFENIIAPVVKYAFDVITDLSDALKQTLSGICTFISGVFTGNWAAAWKGVINTVSGIWSGIISVIRQPLNAAIGLVNSFISSINGITIPEWVPGMGGTGILNIPTIPLLAAGGVLERGQVGLLEGSGAEAVVPLEHNRQWTRAVARDMDSALGGTKTQEMLQELIELQERMVQLLMTGQTIVLNDREFGRAVRQYA